jgi:hypothetical protein
VQLLAAHRRPISFDSPANWLRFRPVIHFDPSEIPEGVRGFATEVMFAWSLMSATNL